MIDKYNGKSKCSCGARAKWRLRDCHHNQFSCAQHRDRLENLKTIREQSRITLADEQTWMRL